MSDYRDAAGPPVNPGLWLGLSIGATLMCCVPLGIVGIVYAAMAMDAQSRGDVYLSAERAAKARLWTQWSIGIGLLFIVIAICLGLGRGR